MDLFHDHSNSVTTSSVSQVDYSSNDINDIKSSDSIANSKRETLESIEEYLRQQVELNHKLSALNSNVSSTASFAKGFIIGQLSVVIVVAIFIRFFVFSESIPKKSGKIKEKILVTNDTKIHGGSKVQHSGVDGKINEGLNSPRKKISVSNFGVEEAQDENALLIDKILEKTYYNVNTHQSESLDWFNVLVAQIITQFRSEALYENNIINSLNEFMTDADKKHKIPDWLDTIKINEINIGDDFPIFSNCRVKNHLGKLQAKIDVDLSDTLTLAIETKILINKPKLLTAALPIKLSVSIVRFSGCLTISLDSGESETDNNSLSLGGVLNFGFASDYRLEFKTESLIGARSKLENVPKISYLIENQLQSWFIERCVEPRFQSVKLPNMWPRKKNTRNV